MAFSYRIGRVLKSHGLQGDVTLQLFRPRRSLTGQKKKSKTGQRLALAFLPQDRDPEGETEEIHLLVRAKGVAADRVVVHFERVDDRSAADRLEGAFVDVDPDALPTLITDSADRMLGAEVSDLEGRALGRVVDVRDNGAQPLLFLGEEEELIIPAVEPIVRELREEGRRRVLVIDPPAGLLEINRD